MYLLDTNAISAVANEPTGIVAQRLSEADGRSGVNPIIIGELLFGLARRPSTRLEARITNVLARLEVLPLEPDTAETYARVRAALERAGTPIGPNDLWIAAHALTLGATLVTANEREFRRVDGLTVENWSADG